MDNKEKSPKFSDVLGALVTSVAHGRKVADVGALHIARSYYKNELLKGLPVPRLRIDKVSISLPLMLSDVIPGTPAEAKKPEEIASNIIDSFSKAIEDEKRRLNLLKDRLNDLNVKNKQKEAMTKYKQFLEIWNQDKVWAGENDQGISVFRKRLVTKIEASLRELKITEGNIEPSDISIIDTVIEATKTAFKESMQQAYYNVEEEERQKKIEEERRMEEERKVSEEHQTIKIRELVIESKMKDGIITEEIGNKLKEILNRATQITAQEIDKFETDWENYLVKAEEETKIDHDTVEELLNKEMICESCGAVEESIPEIEKFDETWARDALKGLLEYDYNDRLFLSVRDAAEKGAIRISTTPPDLCVIVNTENIKNAGGGPEVITRLNIVLHEEGLEWLSEKYDGKETTRLMPE